MANVTTHQAPDVADTALSAHLEACLHELIEHGYSPLTVGSYRRSLAHFVHWLSQEKITGSEIGEALVQRFLTSHLPACDCIGRCQRDERTLRAALNHLLRSLRAHGQITVNRTGTEAVEEEIQRYDCYLDKTCGLAFKTRQVRTCLIRAFLSERTARGVAGLALGAPQEMREYVMRATQGWTRGSTAVLCGALRSYLRFRAFQGESSEALLAAVPTVVQWPGESLPRTLTAEEIERFLSAFDDRGLVGRRNYAIARCLVDLGLRAGEVAALMLEDIDWRAGTLQLRHTKGGRADVLPLPVATGEAIVAYLQQRPAARAQRALFVRQQAPLDQPLTIESVQYAMRQAYRRSGIAKPWGGTHCLRHSLACRLVNAGTPLKAIADVLRHRSLNTTMIYAKVDVVQLSHVAMPWPRRVS